MSGRYNVCYMTGLRIGYRDHYLLVRRQGVDERGELSKLEVSCSIMLLVRPNSRVSPVALLFYFASKALELVSEFATSNLDIILCPRYTSARPSESQSARSCCSSGSKLRIALRLLHHGLGWLREAQVYWSYVLGRSVVPDHRPQKIHAARIPSYKPGRGRVLPEAHHYIW